MNAASRNNALVKGFSSAIPLVRVVRELRRSSAMYAWATVREFVQKIDLIQGFPRFVDNDHECMTFIGTVTAYLIDQVLDKPIRMPKAMACVVQAIVNMALFEAMRKR